MKQTILVALVFGCAAIAPADTIFSLAMDQQVNNGAGDVIYPFPTGPSDFPLDIGTQGPFTRVNIIKSGGWYYGPYVSFRRALGHDIDVSDPNTIMTFWGRVYQDATNTNRYGDANIFVRLYTADADHNYLGYRDYNLVYGPNMKDDPDKYPAWKMPKLYMNDFARHKASIGNTDPNYTQYAEGGTFDVTKVCYMRFYGTDWSGKGQDFTDVKTLHVQTVPEPATLAALGIGALALLRRRKR